MSVWDDPEPGTPAWERAEERRANNLDWLRHLRGVLDGTEQPLELSPHDQAERRATT